MKKLGVFFLGFVLIVSLFSFSSTASAKSKTKIHKKAFTAQNLKNVYYKKVDSKTTGVISLKGPKGYEAVQVGYNDKHDHDKNTTKAKKNAKLYMKQIVKYIKKPKAGDEIAIQYGQGSGIDRSENFQPMFTISLNRDSYTKLKKYKGDYTKLNKMDYFISTKS